MSGVSVLPQACEGSETRMELATVIALVALIGSLFAAFATVVQLHQQRLDRKLASTTHSCWEVECLKAYNEISPSYNEHTTELHFETARRLHRSYSSQTLHSDSSRSSSDSASSWKMSTP